MQFGSLTRNRSVAKVQRWSHVMIYQQMPNIFNIFGSADNPYIWQYILCISADTQYIWLDLKSTTVFFLRFQRTTLVIVCSVASISIFLKFCFFGTFWHFFCCFLLFLAPAPRMQEFFPFAANNTCHCFLSCKHCEGSSVNSMIMLLVNAMIIQVYGDLTRQMLSWVWKMLIWSQPNISQVPQLTWK